MLCAAWYEVLNECRRRRRLIWGPTGRSCLVAREELAEDSSRATRGSESSGGKVAPGTQRGGREPCYGLFPSSREVTDPLLESRAVRW